MTDGRLLRVGLPVALVVALLATGCASVPTGPSVMVLPGTGKSFEAFQVDDAVCRQWAAEQTGTSPGKASTQSTVGGAAIGTVVGAAAGAAAAPTTRRSSACTPGRRRALRRSASPRSAMAMSRAAAPTRSGTDWEPAGGATVTSPFAVAVCCESPSTYSKSA